MFETRFFVELIIFYLLIGIHLMFVQNRAPFFAKTKSDWILDLSGLLIQGLFIPLAAMALLHHLYALFMPQWAGVWDLSFWASFAISFILVDYIYYWFHRALHHKDLWFLHAVHHSATQMDVVNTSRNSLVTHFVLPYIWFNSFFLYLLKDPSGYIVAFSLTAMMDLWRHSGLYPVKGPHLFEFFFITPKSHAWHHSRGQSRFFYGANWALWDRLHGTAKNELLESFPKDLGIPTRKNLRDNLLTPWRRS